MSAGFHGKEQWTIEGKDLKSGEKVTLSLNLFDSLAAQIVMKPILGTGLIPIIKPVLET